MPEHHLAIAVVILGEHEAFRMREQHAELNAAVIERLITNVGAVERQEVESVKEYAGSRECGRSKSETPL